MTDDVGLASFLGRNFLGANGTAIWRCSIAQSAAIDVVFITRADSPANTRLNSLKMMGRSYVIIE